MNSTDSAIHGMIMCLNHSPDRRRYPVVAIRIWSRFPAGRPPEQQLGQVVALVDLAR